VRIRLILTDLDGTLLEPDGILVGDAAAALVALAAAEVPVCPITSKTAAELTPIMERLRLTTPAGFENGAGVRHRDGATELLPSAVLLAELLDAVDSLRRDSGAPARTLLELGDEELAALTGLGPSAVAAARVRQATLPLLVDGRWDEALRAALPAQPRLRLIRGNRFLHLQGDHTKAASASRVGELAGGANGAVVACGDAPNDAELLAAADVAVIVPGRDGPHPELLRRLPHALVAPQPHGRGWAVAVTALLAGKDLPRRRPSGGEGGDDGESS